MTRHRSPGGARGRGGRRGQGLVEYAMTVPVFLFILLGMLEFGFAFAHNLTLEYSTREGARVGAALASGSDEFPCSNGTAVSPVDTQIIAAVQRVLTSPGSQVNPNDIGSIHIYKSSTTGAEGAANVWMPGIGPTVDGAPLRFQQVSKAWDACSRLNAATPDHLGVSLTYDYRYITPLGSGMGFVGSSTMHMSDRTVMALNPTQ